MEGTHITSSSDQKQEKIENKVNKALGFRGHAEQYKEVLRQANKTDNTEQLDNLLKCCPSSGEKSSVIDQIMNDRALRKALRAVDREIKRVEQIKGKLANLSLDQLNSLQDFVEKFQEDQDGISIGSDSLQDLPEKLADYLESGEIRTLRDKYWQEMIKDYNNFCQEYCQVSDKAYENSNLRAKLRESGLAPSPEEFQALLRKEGRRLRELSENRAPLISSEKAAQAWEESKDLNGGIANAEFKKYYQNIARYLAKTQKLLQEIVVYSNDYMKEDSQTIKEIQLDLDVIKKYMAFFDNFNYSLKQRNYEDKPLFDIANYRITGNMSILQEVHEYEITSKAAFGAYGGLKGLNDQLDEGLKARCSSWSRTPLGEFSALKELLDRAKQNADAWLGEQGIVRRRSDEESSSSDSDEV